MMRQLLRPLRFRGLRLAIAAVAFGASSACSGDVPATNIASGPGCVVEVELVDGGPGMRLVGSGFAPDQPATLGMDDGRNATVMTQANAPALHTDIRGVVRFDFGAERGNVGTNRIELSAAGCSARDSVEITEAMFPPACPLRDPVASGGPKADAYAAIVVADKPVAYWRFEDDIGPLAVATRGTDGAYVGDVVLAQAGPIAGSRAVLLQGGFPKIDLVDLELQADFTIEGWMYFCDDAIDANDGLFGPVPNLNFDEATARLWDGEMYRITADQPVEHVRWYHVALTRSGSRVALYLDGIPVGEGSFESPLPIGTLGDADIGTLTGLLDEVAIYDRALSAEQLAAHVAAAS